MRADIPEHAIVPNEVPPTAARPVTPVHCWNNLPDECFKSALLPFMPDTMTVRSLSRIWRAGIATADDRSVAITLDSTDLDESKKGRIQAFLGDWHGHVNLKFTDRGLPNRRYERSAEYVPPPYGWQWVYGIARSFTNAKSLSIDFNGLIAPFRYNRNVECMSVVFNTLAPVPAAPPPPPASQPVRRSRRLAALAGPAGIPVARPPDDQPRQPTRIVTIVSLCLPTSKFYPEHQDPLGRFLTRSADSLRKLDLTSCGITSAALAALAPNLGGALEELVLDKNPVSRGDGWAEPLAAALRRMHRLRTFSLRHCCFNAADLNLFGAALVNKPHFMALYLSQTGDPDRRRFNWAVLGQFLQHMPSLSALDISGIAMRKSCFNAICVGIGSKNPSELANFKDLDVSAMDFDEDGMDDLVQLLLTTGGLKKLNMNLLEDITSYGFQQLTMALTALGELETLSLSMSAHSLPSIWPSLSQSLMHKVHLRYLDLSNNMIDDNGDRVRALASSLSTLTALKDLYINDNSLGEDSVQILLPSLVVLVTMGVQRIALWGNGVSPTYFGTLPQGVQGAAFICEHEFRRRWPHIAGPFRL